MAMSEDDLQILGADAKKNERRKWTKIGWAAVGVVALVIVLELSFRYMIFGFGEAKEEGTTIYPALQQAVDSLLNNKLEEIDGLQGQVIVMEVETGEILAMAGRERRYDGKFQPCENFCYQQEPGSTMKTVSLLALLETGEIKLDDVVDTNNGVWDVGDDHYLKDHNWHRGGYGKLTLEQALEFSSNIGISKTVLKVFKGKELSYYDLLDKMSFGKPDSLEGISSLRPMIFTSPKDSLWANRQLLYNSIGYERLMAPIQTLTFYNAIANGGKMVKPTLSKGDIEVINKQIAKRENIREIQLALYNVVYRGLGKKAGTKLVPVAGKTGTADVGDIYSGDTEISEYHLSFCGFFPADAPKYSIIVSMNKLGLPASGGGMAGVVFHDIVEWMIAHGMPKVTIVD